MLLLRKGKVTVNFCIFIPILLWLLLAVDVETTSTEEGKDCKLEFIVQSDELFWSKHHDYLCWNTPIFILQVLF